MSQKFSNILRDYTQVPDELVSGLIVPGAGFSPNEYADYTNLGETSLVKVGGPSEATVATAIRAAHFLEDYREAHAFITGDAPGAKDPKNIYPEPHTEKAAIAEIIRVYNVQPSQYIIDPNITTTSYENVRSDEAADFIKSQKGTGEVAVVGALGHAMRVARFIKRLHDIEAAIIPINGTRVTAQELALRGVYAAAFAGVSSGDTARLDARYQTVQRPLGFAKRRLYRSPRYQ
ncbi:MAG: hypothetical protein M3Q79_02150 [bacterium]|nr:hypothetical protein [bacterium]